MIAKKELRIVKKEYANKRIEYSLEFKDGDLWYTAISFNKLEDAKEALLDRTLVNSEIIKE